MTGETRKCLVTYKKSQVILTIYKLFEYNFWWQWWQFIDKMKITIEMGIFNNVKHCHTICLKFKDRFVTTLTMLGTDEKAVSALQIKKI